MGGCTKKEGKTVVKKLSGVDVDRAALPCHGHPLLGRVLEISGFCLHFAFTADIQRLPQVRITRPYKASGGDRVVTAIAARGSTEKYRSPIYTEKNRSHHGRSILFQFGLDSRCFLENGGSGENFFASEDLPLGSFIGTLHVNGDAGPRGNIELRLEEIDSPILIEPGTKNLTLVKRLDKEVTVVGTRVLQGVRARDKDQQGPFSTVQYTVLPGPNSDQGNPPQYTDTLLYVNVIDADDQNPKFVDERYSAILPDQAPVATQNDNRDRYALATLTVSRPGTSLKELQFLQSHYVAGVLENVPLNSVLLTVITNRHRDKRIKYTLDDFTDMFSVLPSGDIVLRKHLDYETEDTYLFQVFATDGITNASAAVNVTVLNVNDWDPRFRFPQYEFFVPDLGDLGEAGNELVAVGMVEAADGDRGDKITLSLQGPAAK
ncbi:unnamed protein product [Nesidiocoris tenuis]|uniref:Cadherin domain-containing protein n=1 Tax=Nesidiocoris tenuis TaxID=355587 RepID=A0A6H5GS86_9HEMI|nr:unnamed protein product [Nesidiocoris tenuis]